jgi:hypothetical protein
MYPLYGQDHGCHIDDSPGLTGLVNGWTFVNLSPGHHRISQYATNGHEPHISLHPSSFGRLDAFYDESRGKLDVRIRE